MTDFAKAQLLKYGWTEGKGLGKNENGISKAIKPKLKFDKGGIGHKDLDNNWWDSIYDKAMQNIVNGFDDSVDNTKGNTLIALSRSKTEIPKQNDNLHYGNFLKTVTLENGNLIKDSTCQSVPEDVKDNPTFVKMSDEELFKACGGRTAHKGARHGLSLNGKLARIAEQEKQFVTASFLKSDSTNLLCCENKRKKVKKKRKSMDVEDSLSILNNDNTFNEIDFPDIPLQLQSKVNYKPSKKTRSRVRKKIQCLTDQLIRSCTIQDDLVENSKKTKNDFKKVNKQKKKTKLKEQEAVKDIQNNEIPFDGDISMHPCIKKSNIVNDEITNTTKINEYNETTEVIKTKSSGRRKDYTSKKIKDCKYKHSKLTEAERKNRKIKLKKIKKREKNEQKNVKKLTKSLLAFSLQKTV